MKTIIEGGETINEDDGKTKGEMKPGWSLEKERGEGGRDREREKEERKEREKNERTRSLPEISNCTANGNHSPY